MKTLFSILAIGALIAVLTTLAFAQVPQMINYQGKLTKTSGAPLDTTIQITFCIYPDPITLNPLWCDTQMVVVEKGVFSVLLGSLHLIPGSVFDGNVRYLGVKVGNDPEMPRKPMVSVGYAYKADTADYAKAAPSVSDNDWVIEGDTIYHLNGKVGIGTNNPTAKLDVLDSTNSAIAIKGMATMGDGAKYGGSFYAVQYGDYNIGVLARGGCLGLPAHPASSGNIGIWAIDGSDGMGHSIPNGNWAGYFTGEVRITDTLKVDAPIKFDFNYDSGWRALSAGGTLTLTHGLGGDASKYVVFLTGKASDGTIHNQNYGMDCAAGSCYGAYWKGLTNQQITVVRKAQDGGTAPDGDWASVMVRILKNQ
jgi:hypothetical protein